MKKTIDEMRSTCIVGVTLLLATLALPSNASAQPMRSQPDALSKPAEKDWATVGGSWNNTRYSLLRQINTHNVDTLGAAWTFDFDESGTSRATPLVKDKVMFITAGRKVYALNAKTGEKLWSYATEPEAQNEFVPRSRGSLAAPNRKGVALGQGLVFVGLLDGHVIALNEKTGSLVWVRQTGISQPKQLQMASPAPIYIDGIVLAGLSNGDANLRGRVTALEAATGRQLWQFFTVPDPGNAGHETWPSFNDTWRFGGGGVWTNAAVDPELGMTYFTVGNPVPAFAGDWRPGDNLYTCSVLAIDIKTGQLRWHYQLVHHDVFEADAGVPVMLHEVRIDGRMRKAISVIRADGYLFQFDRQTGQPLLPVQERAVPQLESQRTSPTQPFPINGESILMSCDDWRKEGIPSGFTLGCMWTPPASPPPSQDPQNILAPFPSVRGGAMAYSPKTGYIYAQGTSHLSWPKRSQDPYHLTFHTPVLNLNAYGNLAAIDVRTGKIAWTRPVPPAAGNPRFMMGSLLATAGGLVFRGSIDGSVEAYDAHTGNALWSFPTGMGDGSGSPITYEVDGDQYIAIPMGPALWNFKIGGKKSTALPATPVKNETFTGQLVDASEIETTSFKQLRFGSGTRYFVDEYTFNPYRARVALGSTVLFVNNGTLRHEIVSLDKSWSTGPLSPTEEAWVTFDSAGQFTYICKEHPWSYGEVVVTPPEPQALSNADGTAPKVGSFIQQALRGKRQFTQSCSSCHGDDLGGRSLAPALSGASFISRWQNTAIVELFNNIRTTMPQTSPGALTRQTYLDIVSYLLFTNGFSSRKEELQDTEELKNIKFVRH